MSSAEIYFPGEFPVETNMSLHIFHIVCAILVTNALGMHVRHKLSYYFVSKYASSEQESYSDRLYSDTFLRTQ
jgi:hypothetical protein